jgi:hypothetical protein
MATAPDGWHKKYSPAVEESFRRKEPGKEDAYYQGKTRDFLDASWGRVTPEKRAEFEIKPGAGAPDGKGLEGVLDGLFEAHKKNKDEGDRDLIAELLEF